MAECQTSRYAALDDELAAVLRSVMRAAEKDHAIGVVVAAFGAKHDVVDVEKQRVLASGNRASTAVAAQTARRAAGRVRWWARGIAVG
jgi:hypothetical protein